LSLKASSTAATPIAATPAAAGVSTGQTYVVSPRPASVVPLLSPYIMSPRSSSVVSPRRTLVVSLYPAQLAFPVTPNPPSPSTIEDPSLDAMDTGLYGHRFSPRAPDSTSSPIPDDAAIPGDVSNAHHAVDDARSTTGCMSQCAASAGDTRHMAYDFGTHHPSRDSATHSYHSVTELCALERAATKRILSQLSRYFSSSTPPPPTTLGFPLM
jgi:hypothetical protein